MQRLIKDAAALDSSIDANSMSFANIVKAINVVQTEMGITGTTAKEAGRTIEGSVNAMKAAWTNLVTGLADKNADIEQLVGNLVTSIVGDGTENNLGVLGNIMPAVKTALNGASNLVSQLLPKIVAEIPAIINDNLSVLAEAAISIIQSLVDGISDNQEMLLTTVFDVIQYLATSFITMLPDIIKVGIDLMFALIDGITFMISNPEFVQTIIDVIIKMVDLLTNPDTIARLLKAAVTIILALAKGIIEALPQLLAKVPEIIASLVNAFGQLLKPIIDIGKNIIDGIKKGISDAWNNLVQWFKNLFNDLIGIAKKILGIASPSKVFKKIGAFTAEGFGEGFNKAFLGVERDIENALDFNGTTFGVNAYGSYSGGGALSGIGGTTFGTVNINIEGYNAQDDDELAEMIAEKLQIMTERKGAVFA